MNIPYKAPEEWKFNPCENKKNNGVIKENLFD